MDTSAAPMLRCLPSSSSSGSQDSYFDECFQSLWHYDCVLSTQIVQNSLNSPAKAPPASSNCFHVGSPRPSDLCSVEQSPEFHEVVPSRTSTHRLQSLFLMLDENGDGNVSLDEMICFLRKLGTEVSRDCLISLVEPLVHNADMAVNFAEFTVLYQSIFSRELGTNTQEGGTQQTDEELDSGELLDTFNIYDKNRDGYICAAELAEVLQDLGFPEGANLQKCQALIDRVDADGNGLVDLQEFKEMLWKDGGY